MKNIILKTSILLVLFLSCKGNGQTVIVRGENNGSLPQNFINSGQYYYKDVHNYLDNFTGTWEYINGNEKFQIVLIKVVEFHVIFEPELNYYEDGIKIRYKKFQNNVLIYESPIDDFPSFTTENGLLLKGYVHDYDRISKTLYFPLSNEVYAQGGDPIAQATPQEQINYGNHVIKIL